mgnify:CR=1 FL=1
MQPAAATSPASEAKPASPNEISNASVLGSIYEHTDLFENSIDDSVDPLDLSQGSFLKRMKTDGFEEDFYFDGMSHRQDSLKFEVQSTKIEEASLQLKPMTLK